MSYRHVLSSSRACLKNAQMTETNNNVQFAVTNPANETHIVVASTDQPLQDFAYDVARATNVHVRMCTLHMYNSMFDTIVALKDPRQCRDGSLLKWICVEPGRAEFWRDNSH